MKYTIQLFCFLIVILTGCNQKDAAISYTLETDTRQVKKMLKMLDHYGTNMDSTLNMFADDFVHMSQGKRAVTDKAELREFLKAEWSYGRSDMAHELITINSYPDLVLTRGSAKGTWTPPHGESIAFETNNVISFRRSADGSLKIWHVIFNRVALENYK